MKSLARIWFFLPLLLAHWNADAQIYMCKDEKGRTITADRPIPECIGRPIREFDKKGIARREILPPPTAEQKRQMELQEQKRIAEELAAEEQRKSDRAMRLRYRSEADIEADRKRVLEPLQEHLKRDLSMLATAEKQRQAAQSEVDALKQKNAPIPAVLQRRMDESHQTIGGTKKMIQEREAEIAEINAKFDETLKRYRKITSVAAK